MRINVLAATAMAATVCVTSGPALSWGGDGHAIVGDAAYALLRERRPDLADKFDAIYAHGVLYRKFTLMVHGKPKTKVCSPKTAGDVAQWPDCVKHTPTYEYTADYHFDDIERSAQPSAMPAVRPWCKGSKKTICASVQFGRYLDKLTAAGSTASERAEALAFVVHLAGDMHQPMHDTTNGDGGGNGLTITHPAAAEPGLKYPADELHAYFDTDLVFYAVGKPASAGPVILSDAKAVKSAAAKAPYETWILQGHDIGRSVYAELGVMTPGKTSVDYIRPEFRTKFEPVVRSQLALAAARLEAVLEDALAKVPDEALQ